MAYLHQFELRAGQLPFQGHVLGAELGGRQRVHGETRTTGHGMWGQGGSGGLVPSEGATLGGGHAHIGVVLRLHLDPHTGAAVGCVSDDSL